MFSVVALGLLTSFAVEALLSPLGVRRDTTFPYSMRAVTVITYTGLAATFLSAFAGSRSYATKLGHEKAARFWRR